MYEHLEKHYQRAVVPAGVREIVRRAIDSAAEEGIRVSDGSTDSYASIAASGKNIAVYVGRSRLSVALDPEDATRAHDAEPAFFVEKDSARTWFVRG